MSKNYLYTSIDPVLNPEGLAFIRRAMEKQKEDIQYKLNMFEQSKSFLQRNIPYNLRAMVDLVPCQLNDPEKSYFLPNKKAKQILLCYNKIDEYSFEDELIFNLVLSYDNIVSYQANWNDQKFVTGSLIRALNLSGICNSSDRACFEGEVKRRIDNIERFKGKQSLFGYLFSQYINDVRPISEMHQQ